MKVSEPITDTRWLGRNESLTSKMIWETLSLSNKGSELNKPGPTPLCTNYRTVTMIALSQARPECCGASVGLAGTQCGSFAGLRVDFRKPLDDSLWLGRDWRRFGGGSSWICCVDGRSGCDRVLSNQFEKLDLAVWVMAIHGLQDLKRKTDLNLSPI